MNSQACLHSLRLSSPLSTPREHVKNMYRTEALPRFSLITAKLIGPWGSRELSNIKTQSNGLLANSNTDTLRQLPFLTVTSDHKPEERLPIQGATFEEQASSFVQFMRDEMGFALAAWSRAPYLCEGDFAQAYYWLDDSVYVFTPLATRT